MTALSNSHTVIRSFSSSKFLSKKYLHEIIFTQTKLNKNNFTSPIAPRAEEIATSSKKDSMACCVRAYNVCKDICTVAIVKVLVCSRDQPMSQKFSL